MIASDKKQLSETQLLKAENFKLKSIIYQKDQMIIQLNSQLADRNNRLMSGQLLAEQKNLEKEFCSDLGIPDDMFDWNKLSAKDN